MNRNTSASQISGLHVDGNVSDRTRRYVPKAPLQQRLSPIRYRTIMTRSSMLTIMHQTAATTLGNWYASQFMLSPIKNISKNLLIFYISKRSLLSEANISDSIYPIIHGHFGPWVIPIIIVIHFSIRFLFHLNFTFLPPTFLSDILGCLRVKLTPIENNAPQILL